MVKARHTRRLRTLRGGGTSSWTFAPGSANPTMNNPVAWAPSSCGGPNSYYPAGHLGGGGLPGLNMGAGVSLQKGGGGGTHYGFAQGGGLFGGVTSIPTNCAPHQSGASGQLNVPQNAMGGGRRRKRTNKRNTKKRNSGVSKKASRRR